MPDVQVLTKGAASKSAKTLGTSSSAREQSAASKTVAKRSVTTRKVHEAPKTGLVSRAAAKSAVKKPLQAAIWRVARGEMATSLYTYVMEE
jgi:hypothetical protein